MRSAFALCIAILLLATPIFAGDVPIDPEYQETGIASWYDSDPEGPLTANGERFDPEAMKAAHKSLPFGTIVRVHDLQNGMTVDVTINDRGPYVDGRIIDLTPAAAKTIDLYERGISSVGLQVIHEPKVPVSNYNRPGDTGWYKIQIGTFSNTETVRQLYGKFHELGFKPGIEIVRGTLVRLTLRWIEEHDKDAALKILENLGIKDVLVRGETNPFL